MNATPGHASVAQLDRAPDFGSDGCRFKSCPKHHFQAVGEIGVLRSPFERPSSSGSMLTGARPVDPALKYRPPQFRTTLYLSTIVPPASHFTRRTQSTIPIPHGNGSRFRFLAHPHPPHPSATVTPKLGRIAAPDRIDLPARGRNVLRPPGPRKGLSAYRRRQMRWHRLQRNCTRFNILPSQHRARFTAAWKWCHAPYSRSSSGDRGRLPVKKSVTLAQILRSRAWNSAPLGGVRKHHEEQHETEADQTGGRNGGVSLPFTDSWWAETVG